MARIGALVLLLAAVAPVHIATKSLAGRSPWPSRFLAAAAWIIGVRVSRSGEAIGPHALLVVNHSSWLDILILGGWTNTAFVSKDDLGHPLIHWLADQNSTVYVKRSNRSGAKDQAITVARALEGDKPVTVFPEGTTGPGTHLLPFRSTLLEAANYAARDVEIRPVVLDYGSAASEVGWFHEPAKANIMRVLNRPGTLPVSVDVLAPLDRGGDRKQLTEQARAAIAQRLGFKSDPQPPIGEAE